MQCPSLAQGFFPITIFELFSRGCKNLETDYLPKSVNRSSTAFTLGSGLPITSKDIFIAWDEVYNAMYFSFCSLEI